MLQSSSAEDSSRQNASPISFYVTIRGETHETRNVLEAILLIGCMQYMSREPKLSTIEWYWNRPYYVPIPPEERRQGLTNTRTTSANDIKPRTQLRMSFIQLIKFESPEGETLFADIGKTNVASLCTGSTLTAYPSFEAALSKEKAREVKLGKVRSLVRPKDVTSPR
jgi:hypothetical protein